MKKYLYGILVLAVAIGAIVFLKVRAQQCDTQSGSVVAYTGGDASTLDLDSMTGIDNDTVQLRLRLKYKGANFVASLGYPVSTNWRMTAAAADFNGDGLVDLAEGGRQCDDHNYVPGDTNLAIFVSQGKDPVNPQRFRFLGPYYINYLSWLSTYEIMALGAGDYDRDGDNDIAALSWRGRLWIFKNLYTENHLSPGATPVFDPHPTLVADIINDGYGEYGSGGSKFRWESNIASVDIDRDGDLDLLVGIPVNTGSYGEVIKVFNNGSGVFTAYLPTRPQDKIIPYNTDQYGVCGIAVGDFDRDGDTDFMVGSAGRNGADGNGIYLYFYRNDGLGNFTQDSTRRITIQASHGTTSFLSSGDLDGDGNVDLVLSTDGAHGGWRGGYVYWYRNDGTGHFTMNPVPSNGARTSSSGDLDSGALGDFDHDGDLDFFVADGNNSDSVYFFMNETYPTYVSQGSCNSKNLVPCSFITSDNAIVSATLIATDSRPSGTTITYYLANSNDESGNPKWEGPVTPNVEFFFESPGTFLRWEAVFTTTNEYVTPSIQSLRIDYKYISKREYSRTSQATTSFDINSDTKAEELLYAASFEFPTWKGHLRSYDVTNLTLAYSRESQLADIKNVGATFVADAGELLNSRPWDTRVVYTVYDAEADGLMHDRVNFDISHKDTIDNFLGVGQGSPEVEPLIKFVLGDPTENGGRNWKLGDINHSSPQALDPPSGIPALMGSGYDTFKSDFANRQRAILAGANDGMLHCFDAATLEEMWAFIPNNLLYKLKMMKIVDPDCGAYLSHQFFVDGTAAIQDVFINGGWHTVLITGQGPGWGKDHNWYYFCLDITNPTQPLPLWEVTEAHMGETWSVPAIGKVESAGGWVAFFGSGYDKDNDPSEVRGNYFYGVNVATGEILSAMPVAESPDPVSPFGIQNTIPGSPVLVDSDSDGYVESAFFGDLLGRLWKIDLTVGVNQWEPTAIYHDPYHYPIITKPAVYIDPTNSSVHLHFGTGGDDLANSTSYYSFIALRDGSPATVDWFMGPDDLATQLGISIGLKRGEFAQGEKVWADDVISDRICYIATLTGSIESLNPCLTLTGSGRIYARNVQGTNVGGSALIGVGGATIEYLQTAQKVRSAVTVGGKQDVKQGGQSITKRKVYIQSYTQPAGGGTGEPPSQVLAQPVTNSALVIKSWREVYKIIR